MMELKRASTSTAGESSGIFLPVRGIADCSVFTLRGESLKRLLPKVNPGGDGAADWQKGVRTTSTNVAGGNEPTLRSRRGSGSASLPKGEPCEKTRADAGSASRTSYRCSPCTEECASAHTRSASARFPRAA